MELTEFELGLKAIIETYFLDDNHTNEKLFQAIRKIMPPTCTTTERAFLDEIRENGEWMNSLKCLVVKKQDPNSHEQTGFLFQSDFTKCNLSELVEGKG